MEFFSSEDISQAFDESRLFGHQKATPARLPVEPEAQQDAGDVQNDAERGADAEAVRLDRSKSQPPTMPVYVVHQSGLTSSRGIETSNLDSAALVPTKRPRAASASLQPVQGVSAASVRQTKWRHSVKDSQERLTELVSIMAFALAQRGVGDAILEQKIDKLLTVIRTEAGENVDSGPSTRKGADPGFDSRSGLKALQRRLLSAWAEGSAAREAVVHDPTSAPTV